MAISGQPPAKSLILLGILHRYIHIASQIQPIAVLVVFYMLFETEILVDVFYVLAHVVVLQSHPVVLVVLQLDLIEISLAVLVLLFDVQSQICPAVVHVYGVQHGVLDPWQGA